MPLSVKEYITRKWAPYVKIEMTLFSQVAHDVAKSTKSAFAQSVLPKFFQCAPSLGVIHQTKGSNSPEVNQLKNARYRVMITIIMFVARNNIKEALSHNVSDDDEDDCSYY